MSVEKEEKAEKKNCEEESEEDDSEDGELWTAPLEELGDMVDVFRKYELHGKTILDVGTDCVKPLYIALKYEPHKIIGITTWKHSFLSAIAENSRFLTETQLHFSTCDFFDDNKLAKIKKKANVKGKFDFILVSKTLHHLRTGKCRKRKRRGRKSDEEHTCREDEKYCIYEFKVREIFKRFFQYGKKVIVYEWFEPDKKDPDKVRGKGGYFTIDELKVMLSYLCAGHRVELFKPKKCHLTEKKLPEVMRKLRHQADDICFSVEMT